MKILLSVDWNNSECQLNVHGLFTEILISGIGQRPFSKHSVSLNAIEWQAHFCDYSVIFFYFQKENPKFFIRLGFLKVKLLWKTTHEIEINREIRKMLGGWGWVESCHLQGRTRASSFVLFLNPHVTSHHAASYRLWVNINT